MELTTLGKTGLKVSRLGVGLAELGGLPADNVETAGRILGAALDGGINFFDTAESYGNSEELIGKTVAHRRSEIVLATKTGHPPTGYSGQPWYRQDNGGQHRQQPREAQDRPCRHPPTARV